MDFQKEQKSSGCKNIGISRIYKPIGSMYGIFAYMYGMINVGKYTIHGSYGKVSGK